jgi:dual-specificity kinase
MKRQRCSRRKPEEKTMTKRHRSHGHLEVGDSIGNGRYIAVRQLSAGTFARVYEALDVTNDRRVAIKLDKAAAMSTCRDEFDVLASIHSASLQKDAGEEERRWFEHGRHRSIATLVRHFVLLESKLFALCFELYFPIELRATRTVDALRPMAASLLCALYVLWRCDVVHSDVSIDNVMMDAGGALRLIDFGSAFCVDSTSAATGMASKPAYRAPEVRRGQPWSFAADMWSAACVIVLLRTGIAPPYDIDRLDELLFDNDNDNVNDNNDSDGVKDLADLLRNMFADDPLDRFTPFDALRHKFFV